MFAYIAYWESSQAISMVESQPALLSLSRGALDATVKELSSIRGRSEEEYRAVLLKQPQLLLLNVDGSFHDKVMFRRHARSYCNPHHVTKADSL